MSKRPDLVPESRRARPQKAAKLSDRTSRPAAATAALAAGPTIRPELFRDIINGLADGVVVTDIEGRLLLFNEAAERILPIGLMDVALAQWSSVSGFLRPDMRSPFPAEELPLARSLRGEVVTDCEIYLPGTGGPEGGWISVSSRPITDERGRILGGVTTVRDITARRRQSERHHLLSKIVEETADAVLVTDSVGNIQYVNAAFEQTTGFSRSEVLGENPRLLKSGMHSLNFYEELWNGLLRGEVYRGTLIDRRKNGDVYLSSQTITPLRTPDGAVSHMVSIARDLTDRRDAAGRENSPQLARHV